MAFVDAVDSFFWGCRARILAANPTRIVKGFMNAQDWPAEEIKLEAFYLLVLGSTPLGPQAGSIARPHMSHLVQWVWIVAGKDVAAGQRGRNRGDRFRTDQVMRGEIMNALYPNYMEKQTWSSDVNGKWSGQSLTPKGFIVWNRPQFVPRQDKDSGLVYGAVSVSISDMLDQIGESTA